MQTTSFSQLSSWQDEVRKAFKNAYSLGSYLETNTPSNFPIFVPPRLARKIKSQGPDSSLWKQFVPSKKESDLNSQSMGLLDPIGDHIHAKGHGIIHRYHNRVLFTPTTICPVQCRYCFRKNELHNNDEIFKNDFSKALDYINKNPQIEEVIFTGGDPLMLSDSKIASYLEGFASVKSLQFVRFHTRMPVIIPQRLNNNLQKTFDSFKKRFQFNLVIHTNHIEEFDNDVNDAIESFHISKLSQSVLLKNVNDNSFSLSSLFKHLSSLDVRPYYLHHPDKVYGGMHFYVSRQKGQAIYQEVAKTLSGWMLPRYVVDPPEGSGKISAFSTF